MTQELRLEGEGEKYTWLFSGFAIYEKLKTRNLFFNTLTLLLDQNFEIRSWRRGTWWPKGTTTFSRRVRTRGSIS